jgi:hypothetical protein
MTTNTITKDELITEWVAALRSGDYKQGSGYLHRVDDDSYCCLGVACEVLRKRGLLTAEDRQSMEYVGHKLGVAEYQPVMTTHYKGDGDKETSNRLLPYSVVQLLGIINPINTGDITFGVVMDPENEMEQHEVSSLNDNFNFTFAQIADLIEEQLR